MISSNIYTHTEWCNLSFVWYNIEHFTTHINWAMYISRLLTCKIICSDFRDITIEWTIDALFIFFLLWKYTFFNCIISRKLETMFGENLSCFSCIIFAQCMTGRAQSRSCLEKVLCASRPVCQMWIWHFFTKHFARPSLRLELVIQYYGISMVAFLGCLPEKILLLWLSKNIFVTISSSIALFDGLNFTYHVQ
jgi:hypothetical protein